MAHVLQPLKDLTFMIFFIGVLLTIFLAFAALLLGNQTAKPLMQLIEQSKEIAKGELSSRIIISRKDEIGYLGNAFNNMTEELEKTTTSIVNLESEIAERKWAEEALQHAKKAAEVANRAKSEFLTNMSHELRTPLNGILGYAQILTREQDLTAQQQERVDIIQRSGEHLLQLINDILDLAKIEAGKLDITRRVFQFHEFIKTIAEMISIKTQQTGIVLTCELAPNLPVALYGDEIRLRQILLNLLGNAIKFTEHGSVTLKVTKVESNDLKSQISNLKFTISDTGIGIPPERIADIFRPFEQMGDARFQSKGTGLGLAISQRLAYLMGSQIQVQSAVGQGSTFWFEVEFPEVEGQIVDPAQPSQHITGFEGKPRNLLIPDDNAAFVLPPRPELRTLLDLVDRGMILEIRKWLDRTEQLDAKYVPFTTNIRQLSNTFEFEAIRKVLTNIIGENHGIRTRQQSCLHCE